MPSVNSALRQPVVDLVPVQPATPPPARPATPLPVKNTRSHGMNTSSSHICPSSSSNRLLSGAMNGFDRASRPCGRRSSRPRRWSAPGTCAIALVVDVAAAADVDVVGEGRAGVHADLAVEHQAASVSLTMRAGCARPGSRACESRSARRPAKRDEASRPGDILPQRRGVARLLRRHVPLRRVEDAQGDDVAVRRVVRDVAGGDKRQLGEKPCPCARGRPCSSAGCRPAASRPP